ncbi:riboflavin synthase [Halobacterium salinarum]|uniref:Riboflavin synthase n=3 Tax=Halobacterium salinarum TaxID=2242 RepID=A0A510N9L0_HALSA|nr:MULTISPECIES: riboflavin synthase [Halobacterium]MBB6089404.1 riboflavin synthase [Halobacterium salinarum]MDL0138893.1 riboflavin synthase [Halobacterium salinarum]MDL0143473.1 riboflavin synthase [Halobacterium salinarum]QRY25883.1 riboflavin synthase [Halobacterium sp. BOL4-2]UEB92014.1 riboflavin synthase [Halobacterium salinarum NRC-34001]
MFTGIIEETGTVERVVDDDDGRRLRIAVTGFGAFSHGESISVGGVCLTVEDWGEDWFSVFTAAETLSKTTLSAVSSGDRVNLERALPADGRLDGHVVQGHVDTTTEVVDIEQVGEDWTFTFALPDGHAQYVAPKGSIALDGISLTVADIDDEAGTFSVAVIPTTYELTSLSERSPGDRVNVEVDVLAKYVERMASYDSSVDSAGGALDAAE